MTGHVFVSHSSDNRDLANELAAFLEARGVRVWIAPRDVRPGMDYSEQLQLAIEESAAFVVLVTDMANKSPYVRAETEMAFSTHKPIFPVRISDIQPAAGLALFLKIRHWTDAYGASRSANLDRLAQELQTLTGPRSAGAAAEAPSPQTGSAPPAPPSPAPGAAAAAAVATSAAPRPAPPPTPAAPANADEEEKWRAAVGPKADLYLERWKGMAERNTIVRWSWAACLANFFWFAYRKMWLPAAGMGFVYLLNVAVAANPGAARIMSLLGIALTFVTGSFGTHLYRQQTARLVASTAGQPREAALETLRKRGGVSLPALWGAIGIVVLLVLAMAAVIAQQQRLVPPGPMPPPINSTFEPGPINTPADPNMPADPNAVPSDTGDKPVDADQPPPEDYYPPENYPTE